MSRKHGGEKYVKSFDGYTHLLTMLFAVMRFDSLREIETTITAEVRKLHHVGIGTVTKLSTLSDANARRSEKLFEKVSLFYCCFGVDYFSASASISRAIS